MCMSANYLKVWVNRPLCSVTLYIRVSLTYLHPKILGKMYLFMLYCKTLLLLLRWNTGLLFIMLLIYLGICYIMVRFKGNVVNV